MSSERVEAGRQIRGKARREASREKRQRALKLHEGPPQLMYVEVAKIMGYDCRWVGTLVRRAKLERVAMKRGLG